MIVVDASVWVSHLATQDANHQVSRRWLTRIVRSNIGIAAPALLLAEVGGAVARRTGDVSAGHQAVEHILSTPDVRLIAVDSTLGTIAAELAAEQRLRGADALYVAVALELGIPLVSWDKEHIHRVSDLITAYTPAVIE